MSQSATKKTPLYEEHVRLGAKMISFGDWIMPVQYTSIVDEHQTVRNNVGVFDISHMGQFVVSGRDAGNWLNMMLTNNIEKLEIGQGQYTFLLNERGGVIDDLIVYRIEDAKFLLVVNAARVDEDFAWLNQHRGAPSPQSSPSERGKGQSGLPAAGGAKVDPPSAAPQATRGDQGSDREPPGESKDIVLTNRSADFGGVAIQGPRISELFENLPPRNHIVDLEIDGMPISIARTGYTGEDGIEVFFQSADAVKFWTTLLEKGKNLGIKPCGLGARDTLRLEMCYPLNGSDLSPDRNPIEAGLGIFVDLSKPSFAGREPLVKAKENGMRQKLVAFRMDGKSAPPRPHYAVFSNGNRIGEVTSGTQSPSLNYGIGMAYIDSGAAKIGSKIEIEIRGQKFPAVIEKKPLYKKQT